MLDMTKREFLDGAKNIFDLSNLTSLTVSFVSSKSSKYQELLEFEYRDLGISRCEEIFDL